MHQLNVSRALVEGRMGFLGYGNPCSDIWFIGIEEGVDASPENSENMKKRFKRTQGKEVIDIRKDMEGVKDHLPWLQPGAHLQPTWKRLIRILLIQELDSVDNETIREFQIKKFSTSNGNHCNLHLLPLPNPGVDTWLYAEHSSPYKTRQEYEKHTLPKRIERFRDLIRQHEPKAIVSYGLSYRNQWKKIANEDFEEKEGNLLFCRKNNTAFFMLPHPAARGYTNEKWSEFGRKIRMEIQNG